MKQGAIFMKSFENMRPNIEYKAILRQREIDGNAFYATYHAQFIETPCPACGSEGIFNFKKYGFAHKICTQCKTLYCSPRPSDALISLYYKSYRAPELWTKLLLTADRQRKIIQYSPRVEKIVEKIQSRRKRKGGVALDIGAGSGAFAICLKNTGYFDDIIALDISESCVTACKDCGLSAKQGTIADIETGSVDFICMNDLIEHVVDPFTLLMDCGRVLKKGGFVSIATPNGEGFDFRILKEQTKNITPPEHINYFNPYSMAFLLERAGFIPVSLETPGILDVEIIQKEKDSGFPLKKKNEYLDYLMEQDATVLNNFQEFIANNRLSSHMLVIAQKNEINT